MIRCHRLLSKENLDFFKSVPYVCDPVNHRTPVIHPTFFDWLHFDGIYDKFTPDESKLFNKIFMADEDSFFKDDEEIYRWVDLTWPAWLEFCRLKNMKPGTKPTRPEHGVTDVEEIVF